MTVLAPASDCRWVYFDHAIELAGPSYSWGNFCIFYFEVVDFQGTHGDLPASVKSLKNISVYWREDVDSHVPHLLYLICHTDKDSLGSH